MDDTQVYLAGIPRASLGILPTPLEPLPRLGAAVGHSRIWVKRDDVTGLGMGGNKTRSLRFLLGDAVSKGCDTILAAGGLQSNLCSLTAAACARLGLSCVLVHNDEEPESWSGNMLLNQLFGATSKFLGKVSEEARASAMDELADELRKRVMKPYAIHNGASTPLGALGYVECAFELERQCRRLDIPLKHVCIVGAMGGTASGFVYGTALLGGPFRVHVISVEYDTAELERRMNCLFDGLKDLLGAAPVPPESVMTLYGQYVGPGYGIPTHQSREARKLLAHYEGIITENVYTSKTAAGMLGLIRSNVIPADEDCCFIHTGGMGALFAQA
jgi:D-cysteine desulfhydrase